MKPSLRLILATVCVGLAFGALAASRWTHLATAPCLLPRALSSAGPLSPLFTALIVTGLLCAAGYLGWSASRPHPRMLLSAALAITAALAAYALLGATADTLERVWHNSYPYVALACAILGTVAMLRCRASLAATCVAVGFGLLPATRSARELLGNDLVSASITYSPLSWAACYMNAACPLALFCALVWLFHSWLVRGAPLQAFVRGVAAGIALATVWTATQAALFFTAMATGQSPVAIWVTASAACAAIAATTAVAFRAYVTPHGLLSHRLSPIAVMLILAVLCAVLGRGGLTYEALKRYHSDASYTYIHFSADGTWRRTIDQGGSTAKLRRCERFIASHRHSAYHPAAMIMLAECQFEQWDFDAATRTLARLTTEYSHLDGYPELLRALSSFAAGAPRHLLRPADELTFLGSWRATRGALLTGLAAERSGQPRRALGLYNTYMEYLHTQPITAWSSSTIRFAGDRADGALRHIETGSSAMEKGAVVVRVTAGSRPISNARVALVQPHYDAAFPADSRQFTGAWSLPAWNAIWAATDANGMATVRGVPYGTYEVVLGLNLPTSRRGFVVAGAVSPVTVTSRLTRLRPIVLVRVVKLTSPESGQALSVDRRLSWQGYPGAAWYSVSVVTLDEPRQGRARVAGGTCWARSQIRETSTVIDAEHFINGHSVLRKGGSYMWIVCAYGSDGTRLSSSEHYSQLHEPIFTLK